MQHQSSKTTDQIDEQWLREWFEFGMRELYAYLACYASFERYYERTRM